jgi:uncharacterized protein (TIGR02284 family)
MANDTSDIRSTLNDLIETLKDGEEGFRTSAEKLNGASIRSQFLQYASERASFARDLQSQVAGIGGDPAVSGSTSGALHRGWIGLKSALTGDSDHAILAEAERGEDAALKNYRDALSKDLPSNIRQVIERQYRAIQQVHNSVRSLRDSTDTSMSGTTATNKTTW